MAMTVHNYRPRYRTSNGKNPLSGHRDKGSAGLAVARPPTRTVTTNHFSTEGWGVKRTITISFRNTSCWHFAIQKPNFVFEKGSAFHRTTGVTCLPAWQLEFPAGALDWIFPRYKYHWYGNGAYHAQILEWATFECDMTLSLCPRGIFIVEIFILVGRRLYIETIYIGRQKCPRESR